MHGTHADPCLTLIPRVFFFMSLSCSFSDAFLKLFLYCICPSQPLLLHGLLNNRSFLDAGVSALAENGQNGLRCRRTHYSSFLRDHHSLGNNCHDDDDNDCISCAFPFALVLLDRSIGDSLFVAEKLLRLHRHDTVVVVAHFRKLLEQRYG